MQTINQGICIQSLRTILSPRKIHHMKYRIYITLKFHELTKFFTHKIIKHNQAIHRIRSIHLKNVKLFLIQNDSATKRLVQSNSCFWSYKLLLNTQYVHTRRHKQFIYQIMYYLSVKCDKGPGTEIRIKKK